jgi:anaerobic selenocysteine-containing dehydrogenase
MNRRRFLIGATAGAVLAGTPLGSSARVLKALARRPNHSWEDYYRDRLAFERMVRTTDTPNCTGACGFNVYVREGVISRVEPSNDYPDADYGPRGCLKGSTYYKRVYSPDRVKYPLMRVGERGAGQWKRVTWDEALDRIASEIRRIGGAFGNDAVWVYPPVPATGLVRQGAGTRFAAVNGFGLGTFYDWYGDLPLAHPMTWNVQTEEHELKDVLNSRYIVVWGSNIVETRLPDAHFFTEARARGTKLVYVSPFYDATATKSDAWLRPRVGTDGALAMGMCNVLVRKGLVDEGYLRRTTTGPLLVRRDNGRFLRMSEIAPGGSDTERVVIDAAGRPRADVYFDDDVLLDGTFTVDLTNGATVQCDTAHTLLLAQIARYDPETVEEITGVPARTIETIATEYATNAPASIWVGTGVNHWYHGDLAGRAIILLGILTGNVGTSGGGVSPWAGQYKIRLDPTEYFFPKKADGTRHQARPLDTAYVVNGPTDTMADREKLWRQVRAMWIAGGNLLGQLTDRGRFFSEVLPKLELIVVAEVEMSTSALFADIVLPVSSWYENPCDITTTPAHPYIQLVEGPLKDRPLFESRTDLAIYHEVCRRLGTAEAFAFKDPEEAAAHLLATGGPSVAGITLERLKRERVVRLAIPDPYVPFHAETRGKRFTTATGRQEIYKEESRFVSMGEQLPGHKEPVCATPYGPDMPWERARTQRNPLYERYPLVLVSQHSRYSVHSSWRRTTDVTRLAETGEPSVEINPAEARTRGIAAGDYVRVFNDHGEVQARAKLRESVPPGVALMYMGWEYRQFRSGHTHTLISNTINPIHEIYFKPNVWGPVSGHKDELCEVAAMNGGGR